MASRSHRSIFSTLYKVLFWFQLLYWHNNSIKVYRWVSQQNPSFPWASILSSRIWLWGIWGSQQEYSPPWTSIFPSASPREIHVFLGKMEYCYLPQWDTLLVTVNCWNSFQYHGKLFGLNSLYSSNIIKWCVCFLKSPSKVFTHVPWHGTSVLILYLKDQWLPFIMLGAWRRNSHSFCLTSWV